MDTRDQILTKLTRLHDKSHPTHHRPTSLRWNYSRTAVSIMKLVMEEGWWWRRRQIPLSGAPNGLQISPPETDWGLAAAPYCKMRWILLSNFFSPRTWIYRVGVEVGGAPGGPRGRGRAPTLMYRVWAPWPWFFRQYFLLFPKIISVDFQVIPRTFNSVQKITPWQLCWKQRQSGLVPFKSCMLESKTRAKVFGKVDTTETYQLPQA